MILEINQIKTNFNMEWIVLKRDEMFCKAVSPFEKGLFRTNIHYSDGRIQSTCYNPSDTSYGSKIADRLSFKVFDNETHVGHIVGRTQKTGKFLCAYPYYEFIYHGEEYRGYEIGFGGKGLFICLYKNDKLLAIVDKRLRVINFKDIYTAYIENSQFASVLIPFILYYDVTAHGDVMEIALLSVQEKRVNTIQKELIVKYDPDFIPRIKAMDGITE